MFTLLSYQSSHQNPSIPTLSSNKFSKRNNIFHNYISKGPIYFLFPSLSNSLPPIKIHISPSIHTLKSHFHLHFTSFSFSLFLLFIFSLYHSFLIQKVNWVCSVEAVTITLFLFPRQFNCYEDNNQLTPSFLFLSFDILNGFLMIVMSDLLMTYYSLLNLKSYSFFFKPLLWR